MMDKKKAGIENFNRMMHAVHPDTFQGALQVLKDLTNLNFTGSETGRPDPVIHGVWQVDLDARLNGGSDCAIVFLAGYANSSGLTREMNEFEVGMRRGAKLPR